MDGMVGNTALYTRLAECFIKHTDYFFGEPETPSPVPQRHIPAAHSLSDPTATETEEKEEEEQVKGDRSTSSTLDRSDLSITIPPNGDSVGGEC